MSARSPITTHILDVSLGRPASGVSVSLARLDPRYRAEGEAALPEEGAVTLLGSGVTDDDGRLTTLLPPGRVEPGTYRLRFAVLPYFAEQSRATFFPHVDLVFVVSEPSEHYHVPLLLSPFGYSTYRGS